MEIDAPDVEPRRRTAAEPGGETMANSWIARHGLTAAEYQDCFDEYVEAGYRPTHIDGYAVDGVAHYVAIWEDFSGPAWEAHHDLTAIEYQRRFDSYVQQGYRPTLVSGYTVDGHPHYAALFEAFSGPSWESRHGLATTAFQEEFDALIADGYRLTHVSGYGVGGEPRYAAIFEAMSGPAWEARIDLTPTAFQEEVDALAADGYRLTHVDGYTVAGQEFYAGIWEQCLALTSPAWDGSHGLTASTFQRRSEALADQGYRPTHVSGYTIDGDPHYADLWHTCEMTRNDRRTIDREISAYMAEKGVPGLSLAIATDERLVFAKGYGYAELDVESVCPSHRFRIASISKPITATAIAQLVESGAIRRDQPVFGPDGVLGEQYGTPTYGDSVESPDPAPITVGHLLQHESGWTNDGGDPMFDDYGLDHDELISKVVDERPLQFEPGTAYHYLNFGYCLLGRIIETVTGQSYETYVKETVLAPCGIDGMEIAGNELADRKPNEVVYYGPFAYGRNVARMDAHGGWIATPTDLLRFLVHVDGLDGKPDLLQPATLAEAHDGDGASDGYAEGWMLGAVPRLEGGEIHTTGWWGHNGALDGTLGYLVRRDDGLSFAVLLNCRPDTDQQGNDLKATVDHVVESIESWPSYDFS